MTRSPKCAAVRTSATIAATAHRQTLRGGRPHLIPAAPGATTQQWRTSLAQTETGFTALGRWCTATDFVGQNTHAASGQRRLHRDGKSSSQQCIVERPLPLVRAIHKAAAVRALAAQPSKLGVGGSWQSSIHAQPGIGFKQRRGAGKRAADNLRASATRQNNQVWEETLAVC